MGSAGRSDEERPRPARAAPAESPARLALKPKAKKPMAQAQDDPNFIDLLTEGAQEGHAVHDHRNS